MHVKYDIAPFIVPRLSTFLFNYIQLGIVVYILPHLKVSPEKVLLLLAFELAILFDATSNKGNIRFWTLTATAAAICLWASTELSGALSSTLFQFASIFFLSLSLKKIRTSTGAKGHIKKCWRAFGYISAGLFNTWIVLILTIVLAAFSFTITRTAKTKISDRARFFDKNQRLAYLTISFHHLHYFSYAYFILLVANWQFDVPIPLLGAYFYIGWITYYIFENIRSRPRHKVILGHALAAISVFGMYFSMDNFFVFSTLWLLTGLGGGTIILMRDIVTEADPDTYDSFKFWEAVGHVIGLGVVAVAVALDSVALPFAVGTIAGAACAIIAYFVPVSSGLQSSKPHITRS